MESNRREVNSKNLKIREFNGSFGMNLGPNDTM